MAADHPAPSTTDDESRDQEWWRQYAIVGLTPDQIVTHERDAGRQASLQTVEEALSRFAARLTQSHPSQLVAKHKAFLAGMRAITWRHLQSVQKTAAQSGGLGIPSEEITEEYDGKRLVSRRVKRRWRSPVNEITQLQKVAMDCSRFEAALDGLLQRPELSDAPSKIEISIPGLMESIVTDPDDMPSDQGEFNDRADARPEDP